MASSAMLHYLARVAREARQDQGRKPYNIASTEPGTPGADPSTVWRFEQGESWPQNADHMIDLYAADLGIEPVELWSRALELWRASRLTPLEEAAAIVEEAGELADAGEERSDDHRRGEGSRPGE